MPPEEAELESAEDAVELAEAGEAAEPDDEPDWAGCEEQPTIAIAHMAATAIETSTLERAPTTTTSATD